MKNDLILLSGADIPFVAGVATIHQPTIYEISYIGEEAFFTGCELLKFSKDSLPSEDKNKLIDYSDFNILMSIMNDKSGSMTYNISCAKQVLDLVFPLYTVVITDSCIQLQNEELSGYLDDTNFVEFKEILAEMFCLKHGAAEEYNAEGELAKKIADKFKKRHQQLAKLKPSKEKISIFNKYISILTVGEHKDINSFMKYTVYQLFDEFQRYQLKSGYDIYIKAKLAGATELQEPEDWMKDLHSTGF